MGAFAHLISNLDEEYIYIYILFLYIIYDNIIVYSFIRDRGKFFSILNTIIIY